jgi:hypothetical protein
VLKGSTSTPPNSASLESSAENSENKAHGAGTQGWVSKSDRHLQLINASIFENHSQNRAKAMEETRKQRLKQKDAREKARFNKHLYRMHGNSDNVTGGLSHSPQNYEIFVHGVRFLVAKNGSKLVKIQGERVKLEANAHTTSLCLSVLG